MTTSNTPAQNTSGDTFANLRRYQYIRLTTFRKSGMAVSTIVWFANDNGKLYVMTPSTTGKLKRIRNNGHVVLTPCNALSKVLGESVEAQAHELPVSAYSHASAALARKYGFLYRVAIFLQNVRKVKRIYIEIA